MERLKKTPLYNIHIELGGKMVPFAGWMMPVQYGGIIEEHNAVRTRCGIFDVSHMGEIEIKGPDALRAVQLITTNDASALMDGGVQYTLICNQNGGVIDDVTLYRFSDRRYMFCSNASNTKKVYEWIKKQVGSVAEVINNSDTIGQIALQGPLSFKVLQPIADRDLKDLGYYRFYEGKVGEIDSIISRTGYTGEDGFEIYAESGEIEIVWRHIMESGKDYGICAAGLGCRDTLRLEMGYPLYGHEFDEQTTPFEASLGRFVKLDKPDFIGKAALKWEGERGVERRRVGLMMVEEGGIPRQGYRIIKDNEDVAGIVTSGTYSPSLKKSIAMGFVRQSYSSLDTILKIEIRKRLVKAKVVAMPFYRKGL